MLKSDKDNYDKLWATNKNKPNDSDDHIYSVLGELDDEINYDKVEEGNVLSSSPIKGGDKWMDDRKNTLTPPGMSSIEIITLTLKAPCF